MVEPTFDHERLDVYRLSVDYVAFSYQIARTLSGVNRQARDQWLRAAQSIPLNIAEGNGRQSLKDKNRFFEIARGSALECAVIPDVLRVCDAIDDDSNSRDKTDLYGTRSAGKRNWWSWFLSQRLREHGGAFQIVPLIVRVMPCFINSSPKLSRHRRASGSLP